MKLTEILSEYEDRFTVCGEFARTYHEENDNVVLKVGLVEGQDVHCYVYDKDLDVTIDATLEQFSAYNPAEYQNDFWMGDNHPHLEEMGESEDAEEYEEIVDEVFWEA